MLLGNIEFRHQFSRLLEPLIHIFNLGNDRHFLLQDNAHRDLGAERIIKSHQDVREAADVALAAHLVRFSAFLLEALVEFVADLEILHELDTGP